MMTAMTETVKLAIDDFGRGLRYVKRWQGKYDPETKLWTVPVAQARAHLRAPGLYGVRLAEPLTSDGRSVEDALTARGY